MLPPFLIATHEALQLTLNMRSTVRKSHHPISGNCRSLIANAVAAALTPAKHPAWLGLFICCPGSLPSTGARAPEPTLDGVGKPWSHKAKPASLPSFQRRGDLTSAERSD